MIRHLPNAITASRGLCGPVVMLLLLEWGANFAAFWLFLAAISTDMVDGFLARRLHAESELALFLDPFSDKLLTACAWSALALVGFAPVPLVALLLLRDLMVYSVSWLVFALMTYRIANSIGRAERWPRFIVTLNWCNVVGNVLIMLGGIPGLLGMNPVVEQVTQLVSLGWALWLEWYAIRLTLAAGPMLAAYLVMLDQIVGLAFAIMGMSLGPR